MGGNQDNPPIVRQAYGNSPPERNGTSGLEKPGVRRVTAEGGVTYPGGAMAKGLLDGQTRPALLVSYVYLKPFLANQGRYCYRDWVLDSGAFSAHNSGTEIKLRDYIYACKTLKERDSTLAEVFSLDVIGDWRLSERNARRMWAEGVEAIPCYHIGEPESLLVGLAKDYPKIALGGCVGLREDTKIKFAAQCFARVWPKKIHGFGFGGEKALMALPFHSVDATNWELGPCKFGRWKSFGDMSVRGSQQNLRAEVEWHLALEKRARKKWAGEMKILEDIASPSVRLAVDAGSGGGRRAADALLFSHDPKP